MAVILAERHRQDDRRRDLLGQWRLGHLIERNGHVLELRRDRIVKIDADPGDHPEAAATLPPGLAQHATKLSPVQHQVIGPFESRCHRGEGGDGVGDGEADPKRQYRRGGRRAARPWPQQHGEQQRRPFGRLPAPPEPSPAPGLVLRDGTGPGRTAGRAGLPDEYADASVLQKPFQFEHLMERLRVLLA